MNIGIFNLTLLYIFGDSPIKHPLIGCHDPQFVHRRNSIFYNNFKQSRCQGGGFECENTPMCRI